MVRSCLSQQVLKHRLQRSTIRLLDLDGLGATHRAGDSLGPGAIGWACRLINLCNCWYVLKIVQIRRRRAKLTAIGLVALAVVAFIALVAIAVFSFLRTDSLPTLVSKLADKPGQLARILAD